MNFMRFIACDENNFMISVIIELRCSQAIAKDTLGMILAFFQCELNPSSFLKGVW